MHSGRKISQEEMTMMTIFAVRNTKGPACIEDFCVKQIHVNVIFDKLYSKLAILERSCDFPMVLRYRGNVSYIEICPKSSHFLEDSKGSC